MVTTYKKKHKRPSTGGWTGATSCSQNYDWLGICCDWSYYHVCGFCSQNLDVPRKKHFASFCLQHLTTAFVHLVAKKSSCFNYNIQFVPCIVPYFILETSNGWTCPPPLPRPLQLPFRMALSWPPKCRQRKEKHMFGIQVSRTWVNKGPPKQKPEINAFWGSMHRQRKAVQERDGKKDREGEG